MIFENPDVFALESSNSRAYERLSFRALGFFLIHVAGTSFGIRANDATMLACSFDAVGRRLARRGHHRAPFSSEADALRIAEAVTAVLFGDQSDDQTYWGMTGGYLRESLHSAEIVWAPDGDEAFDDHNRVLQFDVDDRVRLIAFRSSKADSGVAHGTLRETWLGRDDFYEILGRWHGSFEAQWRAAPKVSE